MSGGRTGTIGMEGHVANPRASMGGGREGTRSRIFAITENDYEHRAKITVPDDVNLTYSLKMCTDFGSTYSLSRNNRFYQPGSDRSVPTSLRAPGSPVPAQVEGQRQRRGE